MKKYIVFTLESIETHSREEERALIFDSINETEESVEKRVNELTKKGYQCVVLKGEIYS